MTLGAAAKELENRHLFTHAWTYFQVSERAAASLARHIELRLHPTCAWLVNPRYLSDTWGSRQGIRRSVSFIHAWTFVQVSERAAALLASHRGLQLHPILAWLVNPRYLGDTWASRQRIIISVSIYARMDICSTVRKSRRFACQPPWITVTSYSCLARKPAVSR